MFATNELTMQLNLAKTKKYVFVSNQQKPYLYTVRNSKGRDFTVNVNEITCTCGWISSRRLTCRHVLVTCQDRLPIPKLAEVVVGRAHRRWLHSTLQQALGLKDLQANVEPAVHSQVETERRLHLPSTNNMIQIAVKDEVQAIVEFARKSAMNARYALACLHRWIPELRNANESTMEAAIALTQQSNVATNVEVSPATAPVVAAAVADSDSAAAIPRVDPAKVGLHRVRARKTSNRLEEENAKNR
jgi:SWIM zinc finger